MRAKTTIPKLLQPRWSMARPVPSSMSQLPSLNTPSCDIILL
ncbi:uncharacterized protein CTRU02_215074 [Colletotrichum truncatum]|uniref:Uncharacterized protein n=1 Tax=Colletotrichum truncatum TaxID=5467 RepID=A0ACC3YDG3_COLTU|nr:uncharacterized protein CTRU02_13737 [Colletotrichum truncatum]KAF6783085.1 hypothetical protein CTRU02_13737 [Colletotrichum truncatum]